MSTETNQGISHLLDGEVIGLTPTGLPMYEPDPTDEYYQRSIEPRENNLLFLRQEQDVDRIALDSIFNRLNCEISKMAENNDEREIYYFPKGSQLSTQSPNVRDNGNHVVYYAVTNERLFARKAKESKSGYEFLPGLDSDVSFYKKQNIGAPNKISTKMIPGLKFYRSPTWKIEKTYFNLSKSGTLGDFDKFCAFIRRSDELSRHRKIG